MSERYDYRTVRADRVRVGDEIRNQCDVRAFDPVSKIERRGDIYVRHYVRRPFGYMILTFHEWDAVRIRRPRRYKPVVENIEPVDDI